MAAPYNMAASYMKSKDLSDEDFPMNPSLANCQISIFRQESSDKKLKKEMINAKGKDFSVKEVEGVSLIHQNDKIRIPSSKLQARIIA
jgi:hypothetical protein